ncbi:RNA helicase required for poly(A+) mRNA export [Coelomomyces lativittatus]|nr:RNA helicase required for poly(A+) mRNA export [Coelomomyces lativittatus]KAJ1505810.1 RNA helicase required for poly(A+) mRNA export [Coelomomyces lativittatus]KAJ1518193.1 RNA helicase required for poly(A+) mRNA export [Coelomomyces lativittatus]
MTKYPNEAPLPDPEIINNDDGIVLINEVNTLSEPLDLIPNNDLPSFPNEVPFVDPTVNFNPLPLEGPIQEKRATSAQRTRSKSRSKSRSPTRPPIGQAPLESALNSLSLKKDEPAYISNTGLYEQFASSEIEVRLANPREDPNSPLYSVTRFEDLNLPPELLRGLYAMNYTRPSKIQEKALPLLLSNPPTNLIAQSQSGTGKTAAFTLTMLKRSDPNVAITQAVCIVNTRELAIQVAEVLKKMSVHTDLKIGLAVKEDNPMQRRDKINDHILIGTPGTLMDLARKKIINLSNVKVLVFDEADAILDSQNLMEQAQKVRKSIHQKAQILLFSATFPEKVKEFATVFAPNANMLILRREEVKVEAIKQFWIRVSSQNDKCAKLSDLYGLLTVGQSIIFVKTRQSAYNVAEFMRSEGHQVSVLTGADSPQQRDMTMDEFRQGRSKVLISTDVLSRGIDVPQINLVINYDMPVDETGKPDYETYVHRIGRTGRFGRSGVSINFIDGERAEKMQKDITESYRMSVTEMPSDLNVMEKMLKKFRFS